MALVPPITKKDIPGVTVTDYKKIKKKPVKIKEISDEEVLKDFKSLDFRVVKNEDGIIKLKKGYGVDKPTIIFNMHERTTEVRPHDFAVSLQTDMDLSLAINSLIKKLR
jgi:spermidine/putrescine-binding protein